MAEWGLVGMITTSFLVLVGAGLWWWGITIFVGHERLRWMGLGAFSFFMVNGVVRGWG